VLEEGKIICTDILELEKNVQFYRRNPRWKENVKLAKTLDFFLVFLASLLLIITISAAVFC